MLLPGLEHQSVPRRCAARAKHRDGLEMVTAYCVQRADLSGYHRMLTVWRDTQPAPSVKRVIGHWLDVLDEIEVNTKAVLGILVSDKLP